MAPSRPTVVYVTMLGLSVVGLWVILTLGRNLRPPPDLSGQWQLTPLSAQAAKLGATMQVEQSGRFLQIKFENGQTVSAQMEGSQTPSHLPLRSNWDTIELNGLDRPENTQLVISPAHADRVETWAIRRIKQPAPAVRGAH